MAAASRLVDDLRVALDLGEFARVAGLSGLDEWQQRVLEAEQGNVLLCCSRQSGKSTTAALLAVRQALYEAGSLILLLSPSQRQSGEIFRVVMGILHAHRAELAMESLMRAELRNRSRIVSLPGSERTTRGYSKANLVILDEAARIGEDLIAAVRPAMATSKNARLVALSTPAGRHPSNWFFTRWTSDNPGWLKVRVPATECPRISAEFLEEEQRELGELLFRQEYLCEFLDADKAAFPHALVERALTSDFQRILLPAV